MYLIIKVEEIENINFDEFCETRDYTKDMIVESADMMIRIQSKKASLPIRIMNISEEERRRQDNAEIVSYYNTNIECEVNSEEEMILALDLAQYVSKYTKMVLYDGDDSFITGDQLKDMNDDDIHMLIEESKIHMKYYHQIKPIKEKLHNTFSRTYPKLYLAFLILAPIAAVLLMIYMTLTLNIKSGWLVGLPIIIVTLIIMYIPIRTVVVREILNKKIWNILYEKRVEICKLHRMRIPKKPSYNQKTKNIKQLCINIFAIAIIPGIILGSILLTYNYLLLGIIMIGLPWILLIMTKLLITDKETNKLIEMIIQLTNELWERKKEYVAIKYQIIEKGNFQWEVEIGTYKKFDIETVNSLDTKNELILEGLSGSVKCYSSWEEIQRIVEETIIQKIIYSEEFMKNEKLKVITTGFKDGMEKIVCAKEEKEE